MPDATGTVEAAPVVRGSLYEGGGGELYDRLTAGDRSEVADLVGAVRGFGDDVLELACGSGRLTRPLARVCRRLTALDLSPRLLELLLERLGTASAQVAVRRADILHDDLGDGFTAAVLGTTSVAMFDAAQRARLFARVHDALVPGAPFLVTLFDRTRRSETFRATTSADGVVVREDLDGARVRMTLQVTDARGEVTEEYTGYTWLLDGTTLADELSVAGFSVRTADVRATGRLHDLDRHLLVIGTRP